LSDKELDKINKLTKSSYLQLLFAVLQLGLVKATESAWSEFRRLGGSNSHANTQCFPACGVRKANHTLFQMLAIAGLESAFEWLTILKSFGSLT
jgi:hypothetical protein